RLIELYGKMDPRKAAPVFEQLDKDLVVELFKNLSQKQVTKVLEAMNPQKAIELTEYYGRVRSGREYDLLREMNQSLKKELNECKGLAQRSLDDEDAPLRAKQNDQAAAQPAAAAAPAAPPAQAPAAPAAGQPQAANQPAPAAAQPQAQPAAAQPAT